MPAAQPPALWRRDAPLYGLLALAVLIVFGQSAWFDFVDFDDPLYLKEHDHVRGGPTGANLLWGLTTLHLANWHPLTWWSWQLDTLIWGYGPRGFHVTNVLLHLLNTCLVYRVVRQWSAVASGTGRDDRIRAFLIALLFAFIRSAGSPSAGFPNAKECSVRSSHCWRSTATTPSFDGQRQRGWR